MNNKKSRYKLVVGIVLLTISIALYIAEIVFFRNPEETLFLTFQDLAFLPVSVLLISYILEKHLRNKELEEKYQKLQIVVSAFYGDLGSDLIRRFGTFCTNLPDFLQNINFEEELKQKEKKKVLEYIKNFDYEIDIHKGDLEELKEYLLAQKSYIVRMFESPNLIEHDRFTDMLWAVYHVIDELEHRPLLSELPKNDLIHLSMDIKRAYPLLILEWYEYMTYLKKAYPYLFSLASRRSPFEDNSIVIE